MENSRVTFDETTGLSGLRSPGSARDDGLAVIWILQTELVRTPLSGKRSSVGRSEAEDCESGCVIS